MAEVDKDDDAADDLEPKAAHERRPKQGMAWIREKADEEVLDLLDPSASRNIFGKFAFVNVSEIFNLPSIPFTSS